MSGAEPQDPTSATRFSIDDDHALILEGVSLNGEDRELIGAFASRIAAGFRVLSSVHDAEQLRAIAESEATRSGLLRALSRDLHEPLASIQLTVAALVDGATTAPARVQRERLDAVDAEVQRLARLIENVIDVGRLEIGDVTPELSVTSVDVVLRDALTHVRTAGRRLDLDVAADLPPFTPSWWVTPFSSGHRSNQCGLPRASPSRVSNYW